MNYKEAKEKAIKEFESELEWAKLNMYPYVSEQKVEANKIAIKAIEQTTWIPVSERIPEKGRQILCCNKYGSIFTSAVTYIKEDEYGHKLAYFGKHYEVIAWMPLPTPYEPQEESEE